MVRYLCFSLCSRVQGLCCLTFALGVIVNDLHAPVGAVEGVALVGVPVQVAAAGRGAVRLAVLLDSHVVGRGGGGEDGAGRGGGGEDVGDEHFGKWFC